VRLAEELTCAALVELVTDYLEGALSSADRLRFEEHLVLCSRCSAHFDQMRTTIRVTGRLEETDLPAELAESLLQAFRGWTSTSSR
jgi:predicted anti-sigma-YlaC factor YlaD